MLLWIIRIIIGLALFSFFYNLWQNASGDKKNLIDKFLIILLGIIIFLGFFAPDSAVGAAVFSIFSFIFKPLGLAILLLIWATTLITNGGIRNPAPTLILTSLMILILSSTPVIAFWLAQQVEQQAARAIQEVNLCCLPNPTAIVLLGHGTTEPKIPDRISIQLTDTSDRIPYAAQLYRERVAHVIIISAGPRNDLEGHITEATDIKKLLMHMGVPEKSIELETQSTNLRQSAIEVRTLLDRLKIPPTVVLITSAYQIRRASLAFTQEGIKVIPAPTDFSTFQSINHWKRRLTGADFFPSVQALSLTTRVFEEYLALFYYYLRGWLAPDI